MQYRVFSIPVAGGEAEAEALNKFLRGNKVVKVDKELVECGDTPCWTFCVQYLPPQASGTFPAAGERREKIDYKEVLDEAQFRMFSLLRKCRKAIADEDGVPAFAVFIDAELAELSKHEHFDEKALASIGGVGKQRVEKYGKRMLERYNEESGTPDGGDS